VLGDFSVEELQLKLKLNARVKKRFATIDHHSGKRLHHWADLWWEAARKDLQAGKERPA
jgi:hypothetical protein